MLMKGDMNNGMYVFQGSVITGDAGISNQNLDKAMLRHLRLGHISERSL